jgi:hypothetical protein
MSLSSNLTILLGDDEFELVPSLKAANAVSNRFSGFQNALNAVQAADLASIQFIIRQGITAKTISTADLDQAIWSKGTFKCMTSALKFISRLANGGRDMADDADEDEAKADDEDGRGNGEV